MIQLIGQIWFCLLLGFLLGLLLGWWLWARSCSKRLAELEASLKGRISDCERSLRSARTEISDLKSRPVVEVESAGEAAGISEVEAVEAPADAVGLVSAEAVAGGGIRDDLRKVEGIGPKIQSLLNDDGIFTWAQLAASEVDFLKGVLTRAGNRFRMHDPATWPDQAKLLAVGRLDELKEFQDLLKGGRAVQ